jgi:mannose-6-phosphate isomerase
MVPPVPRRRVLVFAKWPETGRVKTRLAATIGNEPATAAYRRLAETVVAKLPADVAATILCEPPHRLTEMSLWLRTFRSHPMEFEPQHTGDLGSRLATAFTAAFHHGDDAVAAIGTDCVEIDSSIWEETWAALGEHDLVIGPAPDGGYYLIALRAPAPGLFERIPWSSEATLRATLDRARQLGLRVHLLPERADVDAEKDWSRVQAKLVSRPAMEAIRFKPLFMERVWGGRALETLFDKPLPRSAPIGESWEIVDREEAQSIVVGGTHDGRTLHELWTNQRSEIFGDVPDSPRFPLLVKLLDAAERLSVQVHPPSNVAPELGGEPKTEMWYIAHAEPGADLFAGLRRGVTQETFRAALGDGTVEQQLHRIEVKTGDAIFIPSGRVHAIGSGNVIVEIQQNSDTTYRVFDWNRVGLDGVARKLHIDESMRSIDFGDSEPSLAESTDETIVECPLFRVEKWQVDAARPALNSGRFAIFTGIHGTAQCGGATVSPGEFILIPASAPNAKIEPVGASATVLRTTIPR